MERKASEIFLDLWHQASLGQMEREDFVECAEAYENILEMEYMEEDQRTAFINLVRSGLKIGKPDMYLGDEEEERREDLADKINSAPVHHEGETTARMAKEVQIDQHTFASEEDVEAEIEAMKEPEKPEEQEETPQQPPEPESSHQEEAQAVTDGNQKLKELYEREHEKTVKEHERPITWTEQQKATKLRKIQILDRLRRARDNHVSGPTIAKAAGVDDTKVYAVLNAGQVTIQTYEKISAGLEKLGY